MVSNPTQNDGLLDSTYDRTLLQCLLVLPLYSAWIYRSQKPLPSFPVRVLASAMKGSCQQYQGPFAEEVVMSLGMTDFDPWWLHPERLVNDPQAVTWTYQSSEPAVLTLVDHVFH